MKLRSNEQGAAVLWIVSVTMLSLLFIGALSFGVWAYGQRQDYKNNSDKKTAVAVAANKKVVQAADQAEFAEASKLPLKTYVSPSAAGSIRLSYPKTWSVYSSASDASSLVSLYFYPDIVPDINSQTSIFALRAQLVDQAYDLALSQHTAGIAAGTITVTPYALPKLPKIIGARINGQIADNKQGSMIILPLRDKTLLIWTESNTFKADFDNNILANLTFSP